eukprot:CAMPEP_0174256158 /NCGR_PEP_ID=MMETSP0439-20130205/5415_1 /TAXON_ID=0 /ORGANISM="Stereomyxa ramosa, Strain Chinc5" /LENGTH=597 /DNA_ID=CAMNT_0015338643 /DNA_START=714 /DNA_END=2507 /DNA_ORIENTATION=-
MITWPGKDKHISIFQADWLRQHCYSKEKSAKSKSQSWDSSIQSSIPSLSFDSITNTKGGFVQWLKLLNSYGFSVIKNVPKIDGISVSLAKKIGIPRKTFWGTQFDVKVFSNPLNLSHTGFPLNCHTDFSWTEAPPGFQFLHCMDLDENMVGGDSILVDGFKVVEALKAQDLASYILLTQLEFSHCFKGGKRFYKHKAPLIQLNSLGQPSLIRYNNANREPLDVPVALVESTYRALNKFTSLLEDPAYELRFRLQEGDLLVFNNRRLLHGRSGFSECLSRHLQGCYLDTEEYESCLSRHGIANAEGNELVMTEISEDRRKKENTDLHDLIFPHFKQPNNSFLAARLNNSLQNQGVSVFMRNFSHSPVGVRGHSCTVGTPTRKFSSVAYPSKEPEYWRNKKVSFTAMKDGTKADYDLMGASYAATVGSRVLDTVLELMEPLKGVYGGAQVDLYEHSLQAATRALRDSMDDETVVCALLHDIGETMCPQTHGEVPAAILKPYISEESHWMLAHHEIFQGYYYYHHYGGDRNKRDMFKDHSCYEKTASFCELYDQNSFDPAYKSLPIQEFMPALESVFSRTPFWWCPDHPKKLASGTFADI